MPPRRKKPSAPREGANPAAGPSTMEEEPYIEAFGYKYHHSGRIFVPFDEKEQQRMEIEHRLFRHCLNGALTATRIPLNVQQIVDLGSGTGLWPTEMAVRYPQAQILGIDISRIQKTNAVPPNVRQAYEKLKPGGLLEWTEVAIQIFDFDGDFGDAELCPNFLRIWREVSDTNNINFTPSPNGPLWLNEVGFENIVQRTEILPLGDWAQDEKLRTRQALMNTIAHDHFVDNHCGLLFTKCGWTREQFDDVAPTFFDEIEKACKKPYTMVVFTTARKPREEG
ncbi:hypothetical protein O1611_g8697 [Lasiodiplodia mahajangana]|uniref:Uncharacterized protein n=1 Tax=Lasiodiplodia mahajangana TaxID=1108764 RepID=A0ACC2JC76_9PEZI|nr:hypothetical protein O1611_g8697 [Lasiodiplodia mahajangana]